MPCVSVTVHFDNGTTHDEVVRTRDDAPGWSGRAADKVATDEARFWAGNKRVTRTTWRALAARDRVSAIIEADTTSPGD